VERGLKIERQFENPRARAQMLYYDAVTHLQLEDARASIPIFNQALALVRQLGQTYEESLVLHNLSVAHWESGECAAALTEAQQTLDIRRRLGDREREAYTLMAVAKDYFCLGNAQKALDTYEEALPLWRDLKNIRNEAGALNDQAVIYAALGEWDQAEAWHRDALAKREKIQDSMGLVESEYNLGDLKVAVHNYPAALPHMERALKLARAVQFRRGEGFALRGLGEAHLHIGDMVKPASELAESIRVLQEVGDRSGEAWSWQALAEYNIARGDSREARKNLERALLLERDVGDRMAQSVALVSLARLLRTGREFAPALASVDEAISLIEESRSSLLAPTVRVNFLASKRDAYALRIGLLHERGSSDDAVAQGFRTSEQAHSRALLDALAESRGGVPQAADQALVSERERLDEAINGQAEGLSRLPAQAKAQAAEARQRIDRLLARKQELEARIRKDNPRYAALHMPRSFTLAEVQAELLDRDTVLLEYFAGEERSFVWAITAGAAEQYELPGRNNLDAAVRRFLTALTERNRRSTAETLAARQERFARADRAVQVQAGTLGTLLLGPVAAHLAARRVLVVADGPLQLVPFAALSTPARTGVRVRLGDTREIIFLPSASVMVEMRREGEQATGTTPALAIADPVFSADDPRVAKRSVKGTDTDSEFARLVWSREEAGAIVRLAPQHRAEELLDFRANSTIWKRTDLDRFRLLHIGAHTRLDPARPELSGIVLSLVNPDGSRRAGLLRLHDIYNLRLQATLVVLSACETALGKDIGGEGLAALSRGFLYAGARSVIGTLWSVDDESTAQFMAKFYEALWRQNASPSGALKLAKRWMMAQPRWREPYYWAGFTLAGEWR
jgi:CHAT domain-containing protein